MVINNQFPFKVKINNISLIVTEKIMFVKKEILLPKFGRSFPEHGFVIVREDLPETLKKFVLKHELFHLTDKRKNWFIREVKANLYAGFFHPIGFIICIFKTIFSFERIKFYIERFKNSE